MFQCYTLNLSHFLLAPVIFLKSVHLAILLKLRDEFLIIYKILTLEPHLLGFYGLFSYFTVNVFIKQ